ncbi:MAG TPA: sigma-54 dependent transcriptional regulator [Pirellulaceae bacterium]|nr:sigma-54 dependent transcriptional regulator [Pirellulaceae bacterium]
MNKNQSPLPHKPLRVLFADDEVPLQELIADELPRMGFEVAVCPDGLTAVAALEKSSFDCLVVDLDMPGLNGIQVIERCKELSPTTEAIVLTGKGSKDSAIAALRLGAFDYLQKPCTLVELQSRLNRVAEKREMGRRIQALEHRLRRAEGGVPQMLGEHPSIKAIKSLISKLAPTDSTVLVTGETGTGKELVARAIHQQSLRVDGPFLAVNCGALPENLIESELFGHRKGAFTGADEHRAGLFSVADRGTLFLDEIGELPLALQAKLLRVLESGEVRRVGDNQPSRVDVRLVCATHRDLDEMVERGQFRRDLMYRINKLLIEVPPLRKRPEDIPLLARQFLNRHLPAAQHHPQPITSAACQLLSQHDWPGNVRELANVMEHAAILCDSLPIDVEHLPAQFSNPLAARAPRREALTLREIESRAIHAALDRHHGNKTAAAQELGISVKTLYNKLSQEALDRAA